jgi:hypothetical protein
LKAVKKTLKGIASSAVAVLDRVDGCRPKVDAALKEAGRFALDHPILRTDSIDDGSKLSELPSPVRFTTRPLRRAM